MAQRRGTPPAQRQARVQRRRPFTLMPEGVRSGPDTRDMPHEADPNHPPPPPRGWSASLPEWWVFWWLTAVKGLVAGRDFQHTPPIAVSGTATGRAKPDFLILTRRPLLVLEVQGLAYHLGRPDFIAHDQYRRLLYLSHGYDVVYLYEDDLKQRLDFTLRLAVDYGRQVSVRPGGY